MKTAWTNGAREKLARALIGTVAAGAMAVSAAAPAQARDNGISAGEVIAGALIIGGIAAIAASAGGKKDDYAYARAGYRDGYNSRYGNGRWNDNPRQAVSQCVAAAERDAGRRSWGGRANVTDIRSIKDTRYGYTVKGRIAVNTMGRDWRASDGRYGRGWNGDYRGWNSNMRGYDSGSFECKIERGRITKLKFSGIRGL
ncbi:MAG: hypothetical protein M0R03_11655 [Novosphingobium sp.]|nr:hypothetical protein [Novosphingobium sp.]